MVQMEHSADLALHRDGKLKVKPRRDMQAGGRLGPEYLGGDQESSHCPAPGFTGMGREVK